MATSIRARSAAFWVLGLAAVAALVVPSAAQQTDPNARKASNANANTANPAPTRAAIPQPMVGTVDLEKLFDDKTGYVRIREEAEVFKKAVETQKAELVKGMAEIKGAYAQMERFQPNTPDYKKQESYATELRAKHEAKTQTAERDFAAKEAEMLVAIYTDIQRMTAAVAQRKGLTFVTQASSAPLSAGLKTDPMAIRAALGRTVVYSDPKTDITNDVLANLNYWYAQNRTAAPASPAAATAPTSAPAAPKLPQE